MNNDIIETIQNEDYCDSQMVAKKIGVKHNKVIRTVERLLTRLGKVMGTNGTHKNRYKVIKEEREYRGEQFTAYKMNRPFFLLLAMRFENKKALEWQLKFIDRFDENERLRIVAEINIKNSLWFMDREQKKKARKVVAEAVKDFVEYAIKCGSRNATYYFKAFTNMAYNILGVDVKILNTRDTLDARQLERLEDIERKQAQYLHEYMACGIPYKKIFKKIKKKLSDSQPDQEQLSESQ